MPFSRRFYPKRLTVMCAYILRMGGPGDRTHYPGVTSAMLYQLSYRRTMIDYSETFFPGNCLEGMKLMLFLLDLIVVWRNKHFISHHLTFLGIVLL